MADLTDEQADAMPSAPDITDEQYEQIYAPQSEWADRRYGFASAVGNISSAVGYMQGMRGGAGEPVREGLADALGAQEPTTLEGEARAQSMEGLTYIAPTLPFVGPAAGAVETVGAIAGPFVNKWIQDKMRENAMRSSGGDPTANGILREGAGLAGELAITAAAPATVISKAPKMGRQAKRIYQAFNASPEIQMLAKKMDVRVIDLFHGSEDVKRFFPRAPDGSESIIKEAIERAEDVVKKFPDPDYRPRTLQAMDNDIARENLSNAEEAVGRMPGSVNEFVPDIEGKQVFLEAEMQRRFDDLQDFGGSAPGLAEDAKKGAQNIRAETREAWQGKGGAVEAMQKYEFPADLTRNKAQEIVDSAGYSDVPPLIKRLAGEEKVVHSHSEIQSMMGEMKEIGRRVKLGTASESEGRMAAQMLEHLKDLENAIPDKKVKTALETARKATARKKDLLAKTPANKALMTKDQAREMGFKVVNSREDAERAVEVLGTTKTGMANLRATVSEQLWGNGDLFDKATRVSPRSVRRNIDRYRDGLEVVYGKEHLALMEDLAEVFEMVERGRMGTVGATRGAGSNMKSIVSMLAAPGDLASPTMMSAKAVRKMIAGIETNPARVKVLQEFFKDPETAAILLRAPTKRSQAAWVLGWKKIMAKSGVRSSIVTGSEE